MGSNAETIRTALRGLIATHGEDCEAGATCQARTDGAAALASLEEMARETERLDAVIEHSWKIVSMPDHKLGPWHVWKPGNPNTERVHVASGETPRAAIDAAMQPTAEQGANPMADRVEANVAALTADQERRARERGWVPIADDPKCPACSDTGKIPLTDDPCRYCGGKDNA